MHAGTFAVAGIAVIAEEWFPYDRYYRHDRWDRTEVNLSDRCRCDRWTFIQRRDRSDHMETRLYVFEMNR